jgi:predicted CXXCH cytochrome family protein
VGFGAWYALSGRIRDDGPSPQAGPTAEPPPPDPRLTFDTPFRNVRPDSKYVGDAACAACHSEIDKTFHAHPMGRSAALVATTDPIERFDDSTHNPCQVGDYELWVERAGRTVRHHVRTKDPEGKPLPEYITTADLAIGSGSRGRSYICLQEGEAWETPISWFGQIGRWDLSPGFDLGNGGRRPIGAECLFCHVNQVEPILGSLNRYREPFPTGQAAIGCERCHGPGALHVAERLVGPPPNPIDTSIVNPKHLSADLRSAICAQCHLQGDQRVVRRGRELSEFRPGLPLDLFLTVFARHPDLADLQKSVGQFEQMYRSRCFTDSGGRFGCVSCHDPHASPPPAGAAREQYYRNRCLTCHGDGGRGCAEGPVARKKGADNCVGCHMPREGSSNIVHTSITDHRVQRRPASDAERRGLAPGATPIVRFPLGPISPSAEVEGTRDLGLALCRLVAGGAASDPRVRAWLAGDAETLVRGSLTRSPDDVPAWIALAQVCELRGDWTEAARTAAIAVGLMPESAEARRLLASASTQIGQRETALESVSEYIRLRPMAVEPRLLRGNIRLSSGDIARAEDDCRAALLIHPLHPGAHLLMALCRARSGDLVGGQREAAIAAGLATSQRQRAAMLDRFRAETGEPPHGGN